MSRPSDSAANLLEVAGLTKRFRIGQWGRTRLVHAVTDFSLTVKKGEVVALVGESGSGKTTVARLICRLYLPTSGTIMLNGQPVKERMSRRELLMFRKSVQMIFQDPYASLNPLHTVYYTLSRPLKLHGIARGEGLREHVERLLKQCGLVPPERYIDKLPHELSGGQRQRIGIARALAVGPQLVLADEPTSMLDVSVRVDIMNLMLNLKDLQGLSYIFITHDLAGARYMADRIAIMYAGCLVELGPSDDVIREPAHPYTWLLRNAAPKPESGLKPEPVDTNYEVPDLTALRRGCSFAPRCPKAKPVCSQGLPGLREIGPGRLVRCILYD